MNCLFFIKSNCQVNTKLIFFSFDVCLFLKDVNKKNAISGRIVNVSSVAGLYGYPGLSTYCATKHAIEAVSSVLSHELVKFNISVVTVQPGDFSKATHLLDNHHRNMNEMWSEMSDGQREEYKEYFIAYHNGVAKTGITGKRIKPLTVLPKNVINGFEKAMLTKVREKYNAKYSRLPNRQTDMFVYLISRKNLSIFAVLIPYYRYVEQ